MSQIPSRILRRLDDGRVVYRRHLRAKAMVLTSVECERVEAMAKRSHVLQVLLSLGMCLAVVLAFFNPPIRSFAIALSIVLLAVVTLVERSYTRAMTSILDRAPVSAADNVEPRPSIAQIVVLISRQLLSAISDRQLRNLIFGLSLALLASVWKVVASIFGINSQLPEMGVSQTLLFLLVCPLLLRVLFAERQKRAMEKRTVDNAGGP